jgi:hypothetical protein
MGLVSGQNRYISIRKLQGGGVDISLFSGEKAWGQKETLVKYRKSQEKKI